ncbi:hypothetical protein BANRA_05310 [Klebsiella pneumoniae]|uniref:Hsp20/alpha crystallin family protein n=1 Tax=Klebsiella pneumoniae TaxID=573 RepID=A0ABD7UQG5_KLEPN|nr:hypothetical protein BANRA_05310 [Klebsiella pneumoniae]
MDIDFKKLAPWNWFKNEQQEQQTVSSLPVQRNDLPAASGPVSPILQLHREIDRLFDDAFRGFGFPALNMPQWPSDWSGMLKPALDIQETDKQYKIALEVPGVEEKDIQITRQRRADGAWREAPNRRRRKVASTVWSAPTAAFSVP